MKLLVQSTLTITYKELLDYAERVSERIEGIKPAEFVDKIQNGGKICVKYPDGTITTYEMIIEN